jgi:predicted transposase YbfD/YdcC
VDKKTCEVFYHFFDAGQEGFLEIAGLEFRKLWCNALEGDWLDKSLGLRGCRIAVRLDYVHQFSDGKVESETRYYVTSIDPNFVWAALILRLIRNHWQVENSLHFVKDRWWDEDRHYLKRPGLAAVFASLTNAAISVLRLLPNPDNILRAVAESIQWNPSHLLNLLSFKI